MQRSLQQNSHLYDSFTFLFYFQFVFGASWKHGDWHQGWMLAIRAFFVLFRLVLFYNPRNMADLSYCTLFRTWLIEVEPPTWFTSRAEPHLALKGACAQARCCCYSQPTRLTSFLNANTSGAIAHQLIVLSDLPASI